MKGDGSTPNILALLSNHFRAEPENIVRNTVEDFAWLKDAGLSDESAIQHLMVASGEDAGSHENILTLYDFVVRRLSAVDSESVNLGKKVLTEQIQIAEKYARDQIQKVKSNPPYPPIEWLTKRASIEEVSETIGAFDEFKARMTYRDELWLFSSPTNHWQNLAGRAGIALVRDARPILHVVTIMN